jgi:hypothetical protein
MRKQQQKMKVNSPVGGLPSSEVEESVIYKTTDYKFSNEVTTGFSLVRT